MITIGERSARDAPSPQALHTPCKRVSGYEEGGKEEISEQQRASCSASAPLWVSLIYIFTVGYIFFRCRSAQWNCLIGNTRYC